MQRAELAALADRHACVVDIAELIRRLASTCSASDKRREDQSASMLREKPAGRISKMSSLTIFLGKFLGLSYFITCALCMARPKALLDASKALAENTGLLLRVGIFMAGGVAMVIGHNIWSGGPCQFR